MFSGQKSNRQSEIRQQINTICLDGQGGLLMRSVSLRYMLVLLIYNSRFCYSWNLERFYIYNPLMLGRALAW